MKKKSALIFLSVLIYTSALPQSSDLTNHTPEEILQRVSVQLNNLKAIQYSSKRELNYTTEHYLNISTWNVYLNFQNRIGFPGFTYQIEDSISKCVFSGTEKFDLFNNNKTIEIEAHPDSSSFENISALVNSILTLKNVLPLLLEDKKATKSLSDTSIENKPCWLVSINIGQRYIPALGMYLKSFTVKRNWIYKIFIDKVSFLPLEILQISDLNSDFVKTDFSHIDIHPEEPSAASWLASHYSKEYAPPVDLPAPKMVTEGSQAPEWTLPTHNTTAKISLKELSGNVVLLDFWWKNCGPCIESTPYLRALQEKYKSKHFKIVSINFSATDTKDDISGYYKAHRLNYTVLIQGQKVAEQYGVSGAPTFFLLDKKGKIILARLGFDKETLADIDMKIQNAL